MKIEMLVQSKDMLENMLIKVQDDTIDRLLLNQAMNHDDCKTGKCKETNVKMGLKYFSYEEFASQMFLILVSIWMTTFLRCSIVQGKLVVFPLKSTQDTEY